MNAIVVFESHWGNTAKIATAIAEGIGDGARAVSTSEATPAVVAEAELVVAGAPLNAFGLPTEQMRRNVANDRKAPTPPDLSHPSLRSWLETIAPSHAASASFETRFRWSPGSATATIDKALQRAGYRTIAKGGKSS